MFYDVPRLDDEVAAASDGSVSRRPRQIEFQLRVPAELADLVADTLEQLPGTELERER